MSALMAIRTVGNLKHLLKTEGISPETLGQATNISNMTLRRLIRRNASARIPSRYHVQLDFYEQRGSFPQPAVPTVGPAQYQTFRPLIRQIEKEGGQVKSLTALKTRIRKKLTDRKLSKMFSGHVKNFLDKATHSPSRKLRALSAGALLYFLNPFDLLPDAVIGVGYLDDFAVFSLITAIIASSAAKK